MTGRRRRVERAVSLAALAVAMVGLALALPRALDELDATAEANSALDWADREIAWERLDAQPGGALHGAVADPGAEAQYQVSVGPAELFESPLTGPFVSDYLHSFLMPRRRSTTPTWIVCYRRATHPPGARVVWEDAEAPVRILRREGPPA